MAPFGASEEVEAAALLIEALAASTPASLTSPEWQRFLLARAAALDRAADEAAVEADAYDAEVAEEEAPMPEEEAEEQALGDGEGPLRR